MSLGESISTFQPSKWGEVSMQRNSSSRLSSDKTLESIQKHHHITILKYSTCISIPATPVCFTASVLDTAQKHVPYTIGPMNTHTPQRVCNSLVNTGLCLHLEQALCLLRLSPYSTPLSWPIQAPCSGRCSCDWCPIETHPGPVLTEVAPPPPPPRPLHVRSKVGSNWDGKLWSETEPECEHKRALIYVR